MPRIRCHYLDCLFLDERYCSAAAVEINPDAGCLTYTPNEEAEANPAWEDEEDLDDWDEMGSDEDPESLWDDEEDDSDLDEEAEDF